MLSVAARRLAPVVVAALALPAVAVAQGPGKDTVKIAASAAPASVSRGGKGQMTVKLSVKPGWHVYAADPGGASFIPTTVKPAAAAGVAFAAPKFPKAGKLNAAGSPKPLNVYEGNAAVAVPFTVAKTAKPGTRRLTATVGYQACNDKMCLPPTSAPVSASVTVK